MVTMTGVTRHRRVRLTRSIELAVAVAMVIAGLALATFDVARGLWMRLELDGGTAYGLLATVLLTGYVSASFLLPNGRRRQHRRGGRMAR